MGDLNYQFSQVVPYGISDVYKATKLAIADTYGYKIKKADDNIYTLQVSVTASFFSPGENMFIALSEAANGHTQIAMSSISKTGGMALYQSRNNKNISEIMSAISFQLKKMKTIATKLTSTTPQNVVSELAQLKDLLDSGVISMEEFEKLKQKLMHIV